MKTFARLAMRVAPPLLPLGRHVPFSLQRLVLEKVIARLFAEPLADGEFDLLQGRWLRLEISDLQLAWCLTRDQSGLRIAAGNYGGKLGPYHFHLHRLLPGVGAINSSDYYLRPKGIFRRTPFKVNNFEAPTFCT